MRPYRLVLLAVVLLVLGWSGIAPKDRFTWWLEVAPILIALPILIATARRFPLTPLLDVLIAIHAVILAVGGHWTYAEVPLGEWAKGWFGWHRNHYDRLGHLIQGFEPAILARELLLRTSALRGRWLPVVVTGCCLGFSALYELIEWGTAVSTGAASDAFLGTQGDPWDTQEDMFCALIGALAAQLLLARRHDRQIARFAGVAATQRIGL